MNNRKTLNLAIIYSLRGV